MSDRCDFSWVTMYSTTGDITEHVCAKEKVHYDDHECHCGKHWHNPVSATATALLLANDPVRKLDYIDNRIAGIEQQLDTILVLLRSLS
jgi:hypothetical protein